MTTSRAHQALAEAIDGFVVREDDGVIEEAAAYAEDCPFRAGTDAVETGLLGESGRGPGYQNALISANDAA